MNGGVPKLLFCMFDAGPKVAQDFNGLLFDNLGIWSEFTSLLQNCDDDDGLGPASDADEWISLAVLCVLELACDFFRRISNAHDSRQAVAEEMLVTDFHSMRLKTGQFPRKITAFFNDDLSMAASNGTLTIRLYTFLLRAAWQFFQETTEIEGMNSILKIMVKKSPNISLPLLSSRLTVKKALAPKLGNQHQQFSHEDVVQHAVRNHDLARAVPSSQGGLQHA